MVRLEREGISMLLDHHVIVYKSHFHGGVNDA
jgi:hypothetical protein